MKPLWPIPVTEQLPQPAMIHVVLLGGRLEHMALHTGSHWMSAFNNQPIEGVTHWFSESMPPELAKVLERLKDKSVDSHNYMRIHMNDIHTLLKFLGYE